jgi:hypothetical protein
MALTSLVLFGANADIANKQQPSDTHTFLLHFSRSIDTTSLSIRYSLTGGVGLYGATVRTQANVWDYAIETSYEGKPARTLKVIVFCPGYATKLLEIASLDDSEKVADVDLEPLGSVRLSGRVIPPPGPEDSGLIIEASYVADWGHQFFGILDGPVSAFPLASATLSQRGSFSMTVPDLAHDPTINSFKWHGAIEFVAREPKTGNIVYWLEKAIESVGDNRIQVAEAYKGLILYARPNR